MEVKLFEVRDRATFMPCFAFLVNPTAIVDATTASAAEVDMHNSEGWLIRRAGFDPADGHVIFGSLEDASRCACEPYDWPVSPRTLREAHRYIVDHWDELASGDVVDVEFVLGETPWCKMSERGTVP